MIDFPAFARRSRLLLALCWILPAAVARAAPSLDGALLDAASFAQSCAGKEMPMGAAPQTLVWTRQGKPAYGGAKYGATLELGARHLRIGFTKPVAVGSVWVSGGGALSVLKAGSPYPGDLADESQWLPAERLVKGEVSAAEVTGRNYAIWVLPPGTQTQALRFTHVAAAGDRELAGWLGGLWILPERLANLAPQALVQTVARDEDSAKLVDESDNEGWKTWNNGPDGAVVPVSAAHPETITLTWPQAVKLSGLGLLSIGFQSCEVAVFTGPADLTVRDAPEANWQRVAAADTMDLFYPLALAPHQLDFAREVVTRAVRLRLTGGPQATHQHLAARVKSGRQVWLGELMALAPLKEAALATVVLPKVLEEPPPIALKFNLAEPGLVTLVIEDLHNHRVRNLVSEAPFPAGANTAWWDGSDDLLRDPEAAHHGVYHIPSRPVAPGSYKVRGLWHKPLRLHYEFSIYSAGKPVWETADKTGCWMTTHTPPTSMACVPGSRTADGQPLVFMGAEVAEGGHGLQWLNEAGTKLGGQMWVGGNWTGAPTLAVDAGPQALPAHLCYVGSVWAGELRLTAKTPKLDDQPIFKAPLGKARSLDGVGPSQLTESDQEVLAGIAARDGTLVCSLGRRNELLFIDAKAGQIAGRLAVANPRGVTFDAAGRMLVLSGGKLLRYASWNATSPEVVVSNGLEDPRHVTTDAHGDFFITDRGASHQVKVFSPAGKLLRAIGKPGAPAAGAYDPLHLNHPNGLAMDSQGRLWVAEADNQPRRVSVWSPQGELVRAFYGPSEYGGGGVLDPRDGNRFYYRGMEFALDWKAGSDALRRVFFRPDPTMKAHYGYYSPDTPLYPEACRGERYFTSCYTQNPTAGDPAAFLWHDDGKVARLVAGLGRAQAWAALRAPEFRALWPAGTSPENEQPKPEQQVTFAWSDTNGDGQPQPAEVRMIQQQAGGVTVMDDLSFLVSRFNDSTARFSPLAIDARGVPAYDLTKPETLGPAGGAPPSSGGDQALRDPAGWTVATNAPAPFSAYGIGGIYQGEPRWSYPSAWPGLHASHEAPVPDRPGMVIGHTRLLGGLIQGAAGPMFCVNGNMGNMYLFTADGLFVATLFNDSRTKPKLATPLAIRDMDVTELTLKDENFWPSITQTPDGKVYLVDGVFTSLIRVEGLETIQRLPEQTVTVSAADLAKSRAWFARAEAARQNARGRDTLSVAIRNQAPVVDGQLDDWPATTEWAAIDRRGVKANFNSHSMPYEVSAAVCVSTERMFAAWRTGDKSLLDNSGDTPNALFKTGGCLDLMLQTATDQRLLVTRVKGRPRALLYRAKVAGTTQPVAFSSPWRTITLDAVEDVTDRVAFAADGTGNYELSIPLAALHWQPKPGDTVRADLGVLRGSNFQTTQRVYWSNKATAITADVPSEAELTPKLWGKWRVSTEPPAL